MKKPYYDHDFIWSQRDAIKHPVWGGNSHRVYRGLLELLEKNDIRSGIILDVGCGAGAFGTVAKPLGYDYMGVDASAVAIKLGKEHYPEVELAVSDFATPDTSAIAQRTFSIVTCINVLHCLTGSVERMQMLKNLYDAANPSGVLVLTTMIGPVEEDAQEKRLPRCYKLGSEIVEELRQAGWTRVMSHEEIPAGDFSKIGNLVIMCAKS